MEYHVGFGNVGLVLVVMVVVMVAKVVAVDRFQAI